MTVASLNTQLSKFYVTMMVIGSALMLTNVVSDAAIKVEVSVPMLVILLILGVALSIAYVVNYALMLWVSYKNVSHFGRSWGHGMQIEKRLYETYRLDNTLMLCGGTILMVLFFLSSWLLWGLFFAVFFASLITTVRICILHISAGKLRVNESGEHDA